MSTTIRDVVIKVAIDSKGMKLPAPNLAPWIKSIQDLEKRVAAQEKVTVQSTKAQQEADKQGEISEKVARNRIKLLAQIQKAEAKTAQEQVRAQDSASRAAEMAARRVKQSQLQVADAFSQSTQGALVFARGLAFIGAASEDDLKKAVQTIAQVQGGLDLLRGGVQVVKQLAAAQKAVTAASSAMAAAESARAAATGTATAATVASTGAVKALTAAMLANPIAAVLVGIAAASAGVAAAFKAIGASSVDLGKAENAARKLQAQILSMGHASRVFQAEMDAQQMVNRVFDPILNEAERVKAAEKIVTDAQARLEKVQAPVQHKLGVFGGELEAQRLRDIEQAQQALIQGEQELLKLTQQREQQAAASAGKELELAKSTLETKREQFRLEQNRLQTLDEIIGRMTDMERAEFESLSKKVLEGDASRGERLRFEQLGGDEARQITSRQFAEEGRQSGSQEIFAPLRAENRRAAEEMKALEEVVVSAQRERVDELSDMVDELDRIAKGASQERLEQSQRLARLIIENFSTKDDLRVIEEAIRRQQQVSSSQ